MLSGTSANAGGPSYRPRHPERTAFYQLFEQHFEDYIRAYEERFEPQDGPLRPVVKKTVEAYLACGRLEGGFARIWCPTCKVQHLLAFSCQTRCFCSSCQAKRAALFAEKLREEILAPVPHRHFIVTIPKVLRGLIKRERRLLSLLSQTTYDSIKRCYQALFERDDVRPGCVTSIQTFGSFGANHHPHVHALVTDGVFTPEGEFLPLPAIDPKAIEELFRRLLLQRLNRAERLSDDFKEKLMSWIHSGFSVCADQVVLPDEPDRLERLARYLTRAPIKLDTVSKGPSGMVQVTTPPDPKTGATVQLFDPLEWIHNVCRHIPDRGQHLARYYGAYANRSHVPRRTTSPENTLANDEDDSAFTIARRASWARLLRKILEVDPMLCPRCGGPMHVISVITDPVVVDRILHHLRDHGIESPFESARSPPDDAPRASTNPATGA